jgi:FixJ family two-component response regulator
VKVDKNGGNNDLRTYTGTARLHCGRRCGILPVGRAVAALGGLTAVSFHSGSAFLKVAADLVDGCVIVDVRMPGMGGLELQKQLKSLGFKLPIIVMTLKGDIETAVRAMKRRCGRFH